MVSAAEFVGKVLIPLREGWGYIYGYAGTVWTRALQDKIEQTTDDSRAASRRYGAKWIGKRVTDCSGLLRWALRQLGEDIVHHARYQYTDYCKKKGRLQNGRRDDGQEILPGTAVFLQGNKDRIHHVGVYVGGGVCVEAKGAYYGVVTSGLSHWDHWGELKMVDYTGAESIDISGEIESMSETQTGPAVIGMAVAVNPRNKLNVRRRPASGASVVTQIARGTQVEILAKEPEWWQISADGIVGWAWAEYLREVDEGDGVKAGDPEASAEAPEAEAGAAEADGSREPEEAKAPEGEAEQAGDPEEAGELRGRLLALREILDEILTRWGGGVP